MQDLTTESSKLPEIKHDVGRGVLELVGLVSVLVFTLNTT